MSASLFPRAVCNSRLSHVPRERTTKKRRMEIGPDGKRTSCYLYLDSDGEADPPEATAAAPAQGSGSGIQAASVPPLPSAAAAAAAASRADNPRRASRRSVLGLATFSSGPIAGGGVARSSTHPIPRRARPTSSYYPPLPPLPPPSQPPPDRPLPPIPDIEGNGNSHRNENNINNFEKKAEVEVEKKTKRRRRGVVGFCMGRGGVVVAIIFLILGLATAAVVLGALLSRERNSCAAGGKDAASTSQVPPTPTATAGSTGLPTKVSTLSDDPTATETLAEPPEPPPSSSSQPDTGNPSPEEPTTSASPSLIAPEPYDPSPAPAPPSSSPPPPGPTVWCPRDDGEAILESGTHFQVQCGRRYSTNNGSDLDVKTWADSLPGCVAECLRILDEASLGQVRCVGVNFAAGAGSRRCNCYTNIGKPVDSDSYDSAFRVLD